MNNDMEAFKAGVGITTVVFVIAIAIYTIHSNFQEKDHIIKELQQKIAENKVP